MHKSVRICALRVSAVSQLSVQQQHQLPCAISEVCEMPTRNAQSLSNLARGCPLPGWYATSLGWVVACSAWIIFADRLWKRSNQIPASTLEDYRLGGLVCQGAEDKQHMDHTHLACCTLPFPQLLLQIICHNMTEAVATLVAGIHGLNKQHCVSVAGRKLSMATRLNLHLLLQLTASETGDDDRLILEQAFRKTLPPHYKGCLVYSVSVACVNGRQGC